MLAKRIRARKLFKPIYRVSYHPRDDSDSARLVWDAYEKFVSPDARQKLVARLEQLIARALHSPDGKELAAVAMSCPDRSMNLKAFDMLVMSRPNSRIQTLQVSEHPPTQTEIHAIQDTHKYLWRLEVFVDSELVKLDATDPFSVRLAGAIQREIGPRNEVDQFRSAPDVDLAALENEILVKDIVRKHGLGDRIKHQHFEELLQISMRSTGNAPDRESEIGDALRNFDYPIG